MAITLLTQFRHQLEPLKDKAYLDHFRKTYCIVDGVQLYDPHHIMGSTFGMKFTDYLLVRASREMHQKWQKDLPTYFPLFLQPAVENLIIYAKEKELLSFKSDESYYRKNFDQPASVNALMKLIHNQGNNRYAINKSSKK